MAGDGKEDVEVKTFLNADKRKIACKYWLPSFTDENEKPRALIFICHGAGEHIRCYDDHGAALAQQGFFVFGHDHVGHGLSEGSRVHVNSFREYTRDVFQHIDIVREQHTDLPLFIIGHSLGGCIALQAGLEKPDAFKGMVLIGPAVKPNPVTATKWKVAAAKVLSKILPQMGIGALQPELICRDQSVVKKYEGDPLVWHGKLKAKMAVELLQAMIDIMNRMPEITWPFFTICGTEDKLVEPEGCNILHEQAASKDKTLKMVEGAYHQVHNEPDGVGSQCMDDITQWIKDRC